MADASPGHWVPNAAKRRSHRRLWWRDNFSVQRLLLAIGRPVDQLEAVWQSHIDRLEEPPR